MKDQHRYHRHEVKQHQLRLIVLRKVQKGRKLLLELITDGIPVAVRGLVVCPAQNRWFTITERIPRKIGECLRKVRLRAFFMGNDQEKVLGVYNPRNERRMMRVDRWIRRIKSALENCGFGQQFVAEAS
ncbi:MAG: hypothetical protein AAB447_00910 [Patescibacteria group bacterium]